MAVDATSMSMTTIWYSMATTGSLELVPRASAAPRPRPGEERRHLELKSNLFELDPLGPRRGGSLEVSDQGIPVDDLHPPTSSSPSRAGRQDDRAGFREIDPCPQSRGARAGRPRGDTPCQSQAEDYSEVLAAPAGEEVVVPDVEARGVDQLGEGPPLVRLEWLRWPISVPTTATQRKTCPRCPERPGAGRSPVDDDFNPAEAKVADPVELQNGVVELVEFPQPGDAVAEVVHAPLEKVLDDLEAEELGPQGECAAAGGRIRAKVARDRRPTPGRGR